MKIHPYPLPSGVYPAHPSVVKGADDGDLIVVADNAAASVFGLIQRVKAAEKNVRVLTRAQYEFEVAHNPQVNAKILELIRALREANGQTHDEDEIWTYALGHAFALAEEVAQLLGESPEEGVV